ncbi:MAG: hypothetical protein Q9201_004299 [Fulgogasparrea decipioides]
MDLLYVENPPGLQILHCLKSSTRGGESLFSDALRAVKEIKEARPDHYSTLKVFPVTYKYHNNHQWYQQTRPHIETSTSPHEIQTNSVPTNPESPPLEPSIKAVNWSPPFQAPFLVNIGGFSITDSMFRMGQNQDQADEFRDYFDAIKHFKRLVEAEEGVLERKLEPGTAVIFDNRRIAHARRAFEDAGGERWLRGAYVDTDAFRSRLRVLSEETK